jgi:hypothetical protein
MRRLCCSFKIDHRDNHAMDEPRIRALQHLVACKLCLIRHGVSFGCKIIPPFG